MGNRILSGYDLMAARKQQTAQHFLNDLILYIIYKTVTRAKQRPERGARTTITVIWKIATILNYHISLLIPMCQHMTLQFQP